MEGGLGGGEGRGWKRAEKQREDGFRNRKKGLIRMVGAALLKDQLTEKGFLGRKGMQGKGVEQVLCSRERRVTSQRAVYPAYNASLLLFLCPQKTRGLR